jgi:hypothetical protein
MYIFLRKRRHGGRESFPEGVVDGGLFDLFWLTSAPVTCFNTVASDVSPIDARGV